MTPEQKEVVEILKVRIIRMREGGQPDSTIRAGLEVTEGWPVGAVSAAFEALDAAISSERAKG